MNETAHNLIADSRDFLSAKYLPKVEKCFVTIWAITQKRN